MLYIYINHYIFISHVFVFFIGPASDRSYKVGVVGNNWLAGWLVTQLSEKLL